MKDEVFNEKFHIENFMNGIRKQFERDYLRLIEYCKREIKRANATIDIMKYNPPQNFDVKVEIHRLEGEIRALESMIEYIQKRGIYKEEDKDE